jgi:hypothetical protein
MRAVFLSAAALLVTASVAMAQAITQPVTFNVFGKAVRQPGTYTTAIRDDPGGGLWDRHRDTMTDAGRLRSGEYLHGLHGDCLAGRHGVATRRTG